MFVVITIILFEVIIFVHEFGHFFVARFFKLSAKEFSIGFGPLIFKRKKNKMKYCFRAFPVGGFVDFYDEDFLRLSVFKRAAIMLSGPLFNILFGFLAVALVLILQGKYNSLEVGFVKDNYSNVKIGDEIKMVNGKDVIVVNDFLYKLSSIDVNEPINLTVERNKKKIEFFDVGKVVETKNGKKKVLGISLKSKKLNVITFFEQAYNNFLFILKLIFKTFAKIFTGGFSIDCFSGPIGLASVVGKAEKQGLCSLIFLFAVISVNVGIFNLLPLFALDGGQVLFLVYEAVFKRPISRSFQNILNIFGLTFLTVIFIFVTLKDIFSLF